MNNWNDFNENGYQTAVQAENEMTLQRYVAGVMRKVYGKMTLGLILTALTSYFVAHNTAALNLLFATRGIIWILMIAELGLVFFLSARIDKLSTGTATVMFYIYSVLTGLSLAPIFLVYTGASIAKTFAITAVTFGSMTLYGYTTRQDLSKFGSILIMALIGLIVSVLVNVLLLHSPMFDLIISIVGVLIFVGLTAWDTQSIKRMCAIADPSTMGKIATMGALSLYLDFINLFLYLLRFFGGSRN